MRSLDRLADSLHYSFRLTPLIGNRFEKEGVEHSREGLACFAHWRGEIILRLIGAEADSSVAIGSSSSAAAALEYDSSVGFDLTAGSTDLEVGIVLD